MLYHGDAVGYGAHELAKVAAYAFFFFYCIGVVRVAFGEADGLVRCVFAGDVAKPAMNAFVLVDVGNVVVVDVEVFPMRECGYAFANEIVNGGKAFFIHPVAETFAKVFDDAEAMLHGGGANLHGCCAEEHELCCIFPGADAADAADGNFVCYFVLRNGCQKF